MRRWQAIAMIIALAAAPLALFAGAWQCACAPRACTMACCQHDKCMMQQHDQCRGSAMSLDCACTRLPSLTTLAPLTQMILPHPVAMPAIERGAPDSPAMAPAILPGFLPSPFHPPRG